MQPFNYPELGWLKLLLPLLDRRCRDTYFVLETLGKLLSCRARTLRERHQAKRGVCSPRIKFRLFPFSRTWHWPPQPCSPNIQGSFRQSLQDSSPTPRSRELAALRADSQLEKGRSPPRPLRPLGSGGTDSALRLVTCWSSDALRLSSSGQTSRFHPHPKLSYTATPRSCRKRPLATLPSLQLQCELSALIN
jgi:hypothetical protein